MTKTTTLLWANRRGEFLLETGYYATVPCDRCGVAAELLLGQEYLCGRHHDHRDDAPEWVTAEKTR
jgi:hypothetical protein